MHITTDSQCIGTSVSTVLTLITMDEGCVSRQWRGGWMGGVSMLQQRVGKEGGRGQQRDRIPR